MISKKMLYKHCVIEGTPYEAGLQLGNMLKEDKEYVEKLTAPFMGGNRLPKEQLDKVKRLYDKFCPGTNEEIKGFADAIGTNNNDLTYYFAYLQLNLCNCSQIAVTPSMSYDGHCYLARNYEYDCSETPILIESHIEGQYSQIGFGCHLFGRFDGMNEEGLCVTTSAGTINPNYCEEGFVFPVVVRAMLNYCKTVNEAVKLFQSMKFADYRNITIIDKYGNAALIEAAGSIQEISFAGENTKVKHLYATNHYNSEKLREKKFYTPNHSLIRYNAIKGFLEDTSQKIERKDLKRILSDQMPDGLCCHYYEKGMGTIWSIIFDSTKVEAEICFGAPDVNEWRTFQLSSSTGMEKYVVELFNKEVPVGFWDHVNN